MIERRRKPLSTLITILLLATTGWVTAVAGGAPKTGAVNRIEIRIENRSITLAQNVIRVTQDEQVELVWHSDERARLHLHGYDIEFELSPGETFVVSFEAYATGRFPITSHGFGEEDGHGHDALLYLEVYPK